MPNSSLAYLLSDGGKSSEDRRKECWKRGVLFLRSLDKGIFEPRSKDMREYAM